MIHAYSESYLADTKNRLAAMFDYAMIDCGRTSELFTAIFLNSGVAGKIERGDPGLIAGQSGVETVQAMLRKSGWESSIAEPVFSQERSPEYWAGWALAEYQWETGRSFRDILTRIPLRRVIGMYALYHEMDISQFIAAMEQQYAAAELDAKLKRIRENRDLTQQELAKLSGVSLRSIQMYEQRVNDIDRAQAQTLFKLSRVLGCNIEDLLEHPLAKE